MMEIAVRVLQGIIHNMYHSTEISMHQDYEFTVVVLVFLFCQQRCFKQKYNLTFLTLGFLGTELIVPTALRSKNYRLFWGLFLVKTIFLLNSR